MSVKQAGFWFGPLGAALILCLMLWSGHAVAAPQEPAGAAPAGGKEMDGFLEGLDLPEGDGSGLEALLPDFETDDLSFEEGASLAIETDLNRIDWLRISGSAGVSAAINLVSHHTAPDRENRQGLSRLRGELDLSADLDLVNAWRVRISGNGFYDLSYALQGRQHYTDQMLGAYEDEIRLGETWIRGCLLPGLDLQFGRQIVVWGKSDNLRVTDIINPMDMREPGMTDIEDLRLPVTMTRLDYAMGNWNLTGLFVHEVRFNEASEFGSDFYTPSAPLPGEDKPSLAWDNQEYGLALTGEGSGWDLGFYLARVFDDRAHLAPAAGGGLQRRHSRVTMAGAAVNLARGNWLFKSEVAWLEGLVFSAAPHRDNVRLDILMGLEYSGFTDTTVSLEAVNRHLAGFDACLTRSNEHLSENDFNWALRISRDFMYERLEVVFLALLYGEYAQEGAVERLEFTYEISDQWEIASGLVLYQGGNDPALEKTADNDRLFMRIKYAF